MSEPENFLSRWSRRKREAEAVPQAEPPAQPPGEAPPEAATAAAAEEPAFDLASLPSLDEIGAGADVSLFMKPGVPAALRHAALRRAWTSDPAIRDFRGLQENDWDFTAPDGVPGFGTFRSEDEIKALAQRLFGDAEPAPEADSQASLNDSGRMPPPEQETTTDSTLDENQNTLPSFGEHAKDATAPATTQQDGDTAVQRAAMRRHGGALPQ